MDLRKETIQSFNKSKATQPLGVLKILPNTQPGCFLFGVVYVGRVAWQLFLALPRRPVKGSQPRPPPQPLHPRALPPLLQRCPTPSLSCTHPPPRPGKVPRGRIPGAGKFINDRAATSQRCSNLTRTVLWVHFSVSCPRTDISCWGGAGAGSSMA